MTCRKHRPAAQAQPSERRRTLLAGAAAVAAAATPMLARAASPTAASGAAPGAGEELRIGNLAPYSGPASAYSAFAKVQAAYFRMLNAQGGVNGRRIRFISYDDGYSPPKAVEQVRKLVEDDNVLAVFQAVGTPPNSAIMKYLNARKVPQLFAATGATKFGDHENFPWTIGLSSSVYRVEAAIYAKYLLEKMPNAKIGLLYANDDYGKDIAKGFKDALGDKAARMIVADLTYDNADPTLDNQIVQIQASGADVFADFTTPRFAALAIRKVAQLGWKPLHILNTTAASASSVFQPAGIENAVGIVSANSIKEPADPRWKDDAGVREFQAFMDKWYPEGDRNNAHNAYGYLCAQVMHKVLEMAGNDVSRENIMRQATNMKDLSFGLLLPGIKVNTSPTNYFPITQMQLMRFNGKGWDPIGGIMSADVVRD